MPTTETWALVSDGVRARILRGLDDAPPAPGPPAELIGRSRYQHLRAFYAPPVPVQDEPARGADDAPGASHLARDMVDFGRHVADRLDSHRIARDFGQLAVFVTPEMQAVLHREMSRGLQGTVFLESRVNLMRLSEGPLRARVQLEIRTQRDPGEAPAKGSIRSSGRH
ncbi:hypothetical protein E0K89_008085 [Aquicoccus sp. SCR17]|nr:hypothetical protein [Carideicomes alvinocaridis]